MEGWRGREGEAERGMRGVCDCVRVWGGREGGKEKR